MNYDMKRFTQSLIGTRGKKPLPVLSFPGVGLIGAAVGDAVCSSELQSRAVAAVAARTRSAAAVSFMDLSVEAECFGAPLRFSSVEVPTVSGVIVADAADAAALTVPAVGTARSGIYVEAAAKAASLIDDRPLLAGAIGPYSLAGRLMGVSEAMLCCYDEPDVLHAVLEKATEFAIAYCSAYKAAGVNGVILAEPLAGLISPALAEEFSHAYVRRIISAVQDDGFAVIYHNCGNNVPLMKSGIYSLGAMGYHFGNAVDMKQMLDGSPADALVMGNVDPAGILKNGTPYDVRAAVCKLKDECGEYPNFVLSTGCDVPPAAPWENIDAFFAAAEQ